MYTADVGVPLLYFPVPYKKVTSHGRFLPQSLGHRELSSVVTQSLGHWELSSVVSQSLGHWELSRVVTQSLGHRELSSVVTQPRTAFGWSQIMTPIIAVSTWSGDPWYKHISLPPFTYCK